MEDNKLKYSQLEMARVIGEPLDPRKPCTDVVSAVCETQFADPNEYVYYFDVLNETDTIYTITSSGAVTSSNVSPDTAAAFTFIDVATPEYYVKITDLASSKEATLARKLKTIERTLNMYENKYIFDLASTATSTSTFQNTLTSAQSRFSYNDLITMVQQVIDYGDNYVLFVGSELDQDIKLWDWNDNKNASMIAAFNDLGIKKVRMGVGNLAIDSATGVRQLLASYGYLIATSTEVGKPFLFVRKRLNDIDLLGGALKSSGEKPERLVFVSPNPIVASGGTTRYLAVGVTGFEEIVAACINPYAVSRFIRS
jgi:hypothetical protein